MNTQAILNKTVPQYVETNICLKDKNWFNTGGSAQFFARPTTASEFQQVVAFAQAESLPITVIGQGANILISDAGIKGLVIQLAFNQATLLDAQEGLVRAGAGMSMHDLIIFCLDNQLIGLEEFSGIPGTVGGSVYINLHYFEFLIEQFLHSATVINKNTGIIETVSRSWFAFSYNSSRLHAHDYYLIDATFKLTPATESQTWYARGRRAEIMRHRFQRYPNKNTCGSFFANFKQDEVTIVSNGKKMIYVAYYLDKIGVKGQLHVGDAWVSYQHANMIVNHGAATSAQIITLARTMQELVYQHFSIIPRPECQLLGFDSYPLLSS